MYGYDIQVWIYDILKVQCKSLQKPLRHFRDFCSLWGMNHSKYSNPWTGNSLADPPPVALVSQPNSLVLPLDEKIPEQVSPWWKVLPGFLFTDYVTLCHYVAQIGSDRHWLRLAQRLSDVGVPHDDGKVGVRVDGRHVGVQRVYERPGSIPAMAAMVFQSCSTLNENIYKHHQKVYKKENLWSSPSWTAFSHWLSGAPNIFPRCSETTTTQP